MEEMKNAPQERGAEQMTFGELLAKHGYNEASLATALDIKRDTVRTWIDGLGIPDAIEVMLIGTVLGCSLKSVYLAILRTENVKR